MTTTIASRYSDLRNAGYSAAHALSAAKAWAEFVELEDQGLVRLRAEEEQESYFDVFGEPEGYTDQHGRQHTAEQEREEIADQIDRLGCWVSIAEYRTTDEGDWEVCDSVGMNTGYHDVLDPRENSYIPDLMRAAVKACNAARYSI